MGNTNSDQRLYLPDIKTGETWIDPTPRPQQGDFTPAEQFIVEGGKLSEQILTGAHQDLREFGAGTANIVHHYLDIGGGVVHDIAGAASSTTANLSLPLLAFGIATLLIVVRV